MASAQTETNLTRRPSTLKTVLFCVLVLIIIAFVVLIVARGSDAPHSNAAKRSAPNSRLPDKVKAKNGPNSDTMPSSTGTGPGSDNSLLHNP